MEKPTALEAVLIAAGVQAAAALRVSRLLDAHGLEGGQADDVAAALLRWRGPPYRRGPDVVLLLAQCNLWGESYWMAEGGEWPSDSGV